MAAVRIAVIGGDGIGPEVIEQAIRVADAARRHDGATVEWNRLPWSSAYYKKTGRMLPEDGWDVLRRHDAILFGAVGSPDLPDTVTVQGLILPMRRKFDQYVNLRPAYLFEGVPCPLCDRDPRTGELRAKAPGSIDMLVYRENTEGEYAPIGGRLYEGMPADVAVQTAVFTRRGCERIMRAAFEGARKRRRRVTSITKSNALGFSMVLWDDVFRNVAKEYPDVESNALLVDAAAMDFVRKPEAFDVLVASNLFGDILTDLSAIVTGSMGLAASGNINPDRTAPSMFEPVHGSAPDIAGKGIANPLAAILSAGMLFDHVGLGKSAAAIRKAVAAVLKTGKTNPPDLGGRATTVEVAEAVLPARRYCFFHAATCGATSGVVRPSPTCTSGGGPGGTGLALVLCTRAALRRPSVRLSMQHREGCFSPAIGGHPPNCGAAWHNPADVVPPHNWGGVPRRVCEPSVSQVV
jgi:tartrate dehydrogenase/decarboxylase/D-malate dehydrogenase